MRTETVTVGYDHASKISKGKNVSNLPICHVASAVPLLLYTQTHSATSVILSISAPILSISHTQPNP